MRFVSLGLCTIIALGCGDGDQSTIDPNFLSRGAGPGATPGGEGGGAKPDVGGSSPETDPMLEPEASACGDPAASVDACSADGTGSERASSEGTLPPDDREGSGSDDGAGDGPSGAGGGASSSADGAGNDGGGAGNHAGGTAGGTAGDTAGTGGGDVGGGSGGDGGGGTGTETEPLPDLVLDAAYLMATIQQDFVDASADQCLFNEGCVTGDGRRRVVRFGTRSANVGTADVIVGEPVAGNPLWEFDVCHEHFHFEGYARYDLVEAGSGAVLPIGNKNGFCLRDLDSWSNPSCATYDCDFQGISVGCADVYTPDLDCQWVDITDVAPGRYQLVVTVNTERSIREQTFDNNSASVTIEVAADTVRVIP